MLPSNSLCSQPEGPAGSTCVLTLVTMPPLVPPTRIRSWAAAHKQAYTQQPQGRLDQGACGCAMPAVIHLCRSTEYNAGRLLQPSVTVPYCQCVSTVAARVCETMPLPVHETQCSQRCRCPEHSHTALQLSCMALLPLAGKDGMTDHDTEMDQGFLCGTPTVQLVITCRQMQ